MAFIVDTTASMGGLIKAAQKRMVEMVDSLATAVDVDMQLGVVELQRTSMSAPRCPSPPAKIGGGGLLGSIRFDWLSKMWPNSSGSSA